MSAPTNPVDIILAPYKDDSHAKCPVITFQVTDDCCLNCSYCYQTNKGHRIMTKETIKKCIDLLFKMYDENKDDTLINHHTKGLIIEFIGGEPLLNMETVTYGSEYFIDQCIQKHHQWLNNFIFSISSNGILYFDKLFQKYIQKFYPFLSLNITIDGPKHLHDLCRKDFNNEGSFDRAIAAFNDWKKYNKHPSTKVTIAPENLPYLSDIVNFFIEAGSNQINANPIFEHNWTIEEAKVYYKELYKIADICLNNLDISTSLFTERCGLPMLSNNNQSWCGGTGLMLAFDPEGQAYPCLRYMSSSLGSDRKPIIIGNYNGIYKTKEEKEIYNKLNNITRKSQSTNECFNCSVAWECAWCSAWNYQELGTPNKRSTNICWMHRTRSLVNSYYYNNYYRLSEIERRMPVYLNRDLATKIISDEEYDLLLQLSFYT